jgi:hypothetical protein
MLKRLDARKVSTFENLKSEIKNYLQKSLALNGLLAAISI